MVKYITTLSHSADKTVSAEINQKSENVKYNPDNICFNIRGFVSILRYINPTIIIIIIINRQFVKYIKAKDCLKIYILTKVFNVSSISNVINITLIMCVISQNVHVFVPNGLSIAVLSSL